MSEREDCQWMAKYRKIGIGKDEPKEQCFIIRDKIHAMVDHYQHQYN